MNYLKKISQMPWFSYTVAACSAVILYMILSRIHTIFSALGGIMDFISPVITGLVIAYLISPLAAFFERFLHRKIKSETLYHPLSVLLAVVSVIGILNLIIITVLPSLIDNIATLASNSASAGTAIENFLNHFEKFSDTAGIDIDSLAQSLESLLDSAIKGLPRNLETIWKTSISIGSTMANWLIGFIIAIYLLMEKKRILAFVKRFRHALLPEKVYKRNTFFWKHCNQVFMQYLSCNFTDALIIGSANAVFMLIFGMPYVALLSIVVAITNLLPTIGPIAGGAIGVFILVINQPVMALWFLIFTLIIQALDAYVIKPKLFGASLGLPAVLTLVSIILGGKLYGIPGIFLAIPVVSVICDIINNSLIPWMEKRKG